MNELSQEQYSDYKPKVEEQVLFTEEESNLLNKLIEGSFLLGVEPYVVFASHSNRLVLFVHILNSSTIEFDISQFSLVGEKVVVKSSNQTLQAF